MRLHSCLNPCFDTNLFSLCMNKSTFLNLPLEGADGSDALALDKYALCADC